jgi:hypothetical protein
VQIWAASKLFRLNYDSIGLNYYFVGKAYAAGVFATSVLLQNLCQLCEFLTGPATGVNIPDHPSPPPVSMESVSRPSGAPIHSLHSSSQTPPGISPHDGRQSSTHCQGVHLRLQSSVVPPPKYRLHAGLDCLAAAGSLADANVCWYELKCTAATDVNWCVQLNSTSLLYFDSYFLLIIEVPECVVALFLIENLEVQFGTVMLM